MSRSRVILIGLLFSLGAASAFLIYLSIPLIRSGYGYAAAPVLAYALVVGGSVWGTRRLIANADVRFSAQAAADDAEMLWLGVLRVLLVGIIVRDVLQLTELLRYARVPAQQVFLQRPFPLIWAVGILMLFGILVLARRTGQWVPGMAFGFSMNGLVRTLYQLGPMAIQGSSTLVSWDWVLKSILPVIGLAIAAWELHRRRPGRREFWKAAVTAVAILATVRYIAALL